MLASYATILALVFAIHFCPSLNNRQRLLSAAEGSTGGVTFIDLTSQGLRTEAARNMVSDHLGLFFPLFFFFSIFVECGYSNDADDGNTR